jgi:hypothetical protein
MVMVMVMVMIKGKNIMVFDGGSLHIQSSLVDPELMDLPKDRVIAALI